MAVLPCWPPPHFEATANESLHRISRPALSPAAHDRSRGAVRLNVPTVAALRRRSVIVDTQPLALQRASKNMPGLVAASRPHAASESEPADDARITNKPTPRAPPPLPASHPSHEPGPLGSRRGSATQRSASAGSSPTSTISTLDSALTGSSPSSSPESPTSSLPMNSFDGKTSHETVVESPFSTEQALVSPPPGSDGNESAGKRPRNVRNLSINTRGISTRPATTASLVNANKSGPTVSTAGASAVPGRILPNSGVINSPPTLERAFSEPSSPSFIVPLQQPRKRRSKLGLTIATPDSPAPNGAVPETPGFAPSAWPTSGNGGLAAKKRFSALKSAERHPFSPSGGSTSGIFVPHHGRELSLPTPAFAPHGGMTLPPLGGAADMSPARPLSGAGPMSGPMSGASSQSLMRPALTLSSQRSFEGGSAASVIHHTVEHTVESPCHELPLSREIKSPSYPNGPACIYPPNVYLYHQPTAEEAREFDVVVNVAKEVPNPFVEETERIQEEKTARGYADASIQCDLLSAPPLVPFGSESKEEEPETPKASSPSRDQKIPEYIHLPWEHNSHVFEEWLEVCELIDARVKQNKKVLIHCQLGVSRSASLIVAYGLYKNPGLSPDEAREAAKKQSKWIDLNMHFMYELGDFKKILLRKFPDIYTVDRAIAAPPLTRTKTESFLPSNTSSDALAEGPDGRRASSAERSQSRGGDEDCAPASAPVSKTWSAEESATKHAEMYTAAQNKPTIDTIPEYSPPLEREEGKDGGSDATTPVIAEPSIARTSVKAEATSLPTSAYPWPQVPATVPSQPRSVPTLAAPSPPQRSAASTTTSLGNVSPATNITTVSTPPTTTTHSRQPSTATTHSRQPSGPKISASINDPAQDLPNLSTLRFSRQDPPESPPPIAPSRMLRPMPSLPGGFTSMRRPNLNLQIQPTTAGTSVSPPVLAEGSTAATSSDEPAGNTAPSLPPLDLGSDSLLSPRTTAFVGVPFKRNSMAGDLAGVDWENAGLKSPTGGPDGGFEGMLKRREESDMRKPAASQFTDPRSPPTRDAAIAAGVGIRSIDDVL